MTVSFCSAYAFYSKVHPRTGLPHFYVSIGRGCGVSRRCHWRCLVFSFTQEKRRWHRCRRSLSIECTAQIACSCPPGHGMQQASHVSIFLRADVISGGMHWLQKTWACIWSCYPCWWDSSLTRQQSWDVNLWNCFGIWSQTSRNESFYFFSFLSKAAISSLFFFPRLCVPSFFLATFSARLSLPTLSNSMMRRS